jgi:hypothetical protein
MVVVFLVLIFSEQAAEKVIEKRFEGSSSTALFRSSLPFGWYALFK